MEQLRLLPLTVVASVLAGPVPAQLASIHTLSDLEENPIYPCALSES